MTDLRSYLKTIKKAGQLKTVKKHVSPKYEIAALTAKADGHEAVLFTNIAGSKFSLVSNLVGTRRRFSMAICAPEPDIHGRIVSAIGRAKKPKISSSARWSQNNSSRLSGLPIVTHFEKEPGPFITSSIIYVRNPESGEQNSSFHRMMPIDDSHMSIRMVEDRHLHRCWRAAREAGQDLEVAVTIGVHPAVSIAGAYQAEWGVDEMCIANAILDGRLDTARCPGSGLVVPAAAEFVMMGKILQDRTHKEQMVEMLQTYDRERLQPVFELDRLYYRNDPIFHDILSGFSEHRLLMGMPIESKLDGLLKKTFPQVRQVSLTLGGCNWLHAVVQINKKSSSDPKRIIKKTFGIHRSLKQVTIVDEDINPNSAQSVEYAMATRFQADRDLVVIKNVRGSSLDPSSDQKRLLTAKMGIDATRPFGKRPEGFEIAKIPRLERASFD